MKDPNERHQHKTEEEIMCEGMETKSYRNEIRNTAISTYP